MPKSSSESPIDVTCRTHRRYRLLAAAGAVPFRIVSQEVLNAPDPAEFGMRIDTRFHMDDEDLESDLHELIEHTAFEFIFAIAVLSFADARPREGSIAALYCRAARSCWYSSL